MRKRSGNQKAQSLCEIAFTLPSEGIPCGATGYSVTATENQTQQCFRIRNKQVEIVWTKCPSTRFKTIECELQLQVLLDTQEQNQEFVRDWLRNTRSEDTALLLQNILFWEIDSVAMCDPVATFIYLVFIRSTWMFSDWIQLESDRYYELNSQDEIIILYIS